MKPKPLTIEMLWALQGEVLSRPQNRRERVSISARPQLEARDFDSEPSPFDTMPVYEFEPVLCEDGIWRHKFMGEVIL